VSTIGGDRVWGAYGCLTPQNNQFEVRAPLKILNKQYRNFVQFTNLLFTVTYRTIKSQFTIILYCVYIPNIVRILYQLAITLFIDWKNIG